MLCQYLRHIDLLAVYDQLPDYTPSYWGDGDLLANIQPQFRDTLAECFEVVAEVVESDLNIPSWQEMSPIDLAAEVGDFVEQSIELLDGGKGHLLPSPEDSDRDILEKFSDLILTTTYGKADFWLLNGLLIYQYDYLCWLCHKKAFNEAFEMCEIIATTRCQIQGLVTIGIDEHRKTRAATRRAKMLAEKRHAPTNTIKSKLLAEWDETSGAYESRSDFCRIIAQREGVIYRTLYSWVSRHEKEKP